jgi:hypothetical protein
VREPSDVFDLVEREVERGEFCEGVETFDMCDEVVVQIDLGQGGCGVTGDVNSFYAILSQAEALANISKGGRGWNAG